jgi:predicted amidophosphoribosyltransferase
MISQASPDVSGDGQVCCPTCGAVQPWSDACRRCRCELGFLHAAVEAARASRQRALRALRSGRAAEALRHARRLYALSPDPPAARLLAVCHFLLGNWRAAVSMAEIAQA